MASDAALKKWVRSLNVAGVPPTSRRSAGAGVLQELGHGLWLRQCGGHGSHGLSAIDEPEG
ncbi:MAG TPA: hypothetical protein VHW65_09605 [Gemmatimonadales bacterium]|jgi:hypothetical protein|nr:hypothetical protein [Gemmatimonadales bacterium]